MRAHEPVRAQPGEKGYQHMTLSSFMDGLNITISETMNQKQCKLTQSLFTNEQTSESSLTCGIYSENGQP